MEKKNNNSSEERWIKKHGDGVTKCCRLRPVFKDKSMKCPGCGTMGWGPNLVRDVEK